MACDLQGTLGTQHKMKMGTKVHYIKAHELVCDTDFIVGLAGESAMCIDLIDFFRYPETYGKPPVIPRGTMTGLVLSPKGEIFHFTHPARWVRIMEKVFAVGSGSLAALGALHAGASPKDAVLAASKVDPFTGMGTKVLKFK